MTQAQITGISPFFIVSHLRSSLSFYRYRLGFEITFQGPSDDDIFFGIVQRGAAMIMLRSIIQRESSGKRETHITKPEISGIAPFFIVKNVRAALSFYRDRLGFE